MKTGSNPALRVATDEEQIVFQAETLASDSQWGKAASLIENYRRSNILSIESLGKLAYYHSHAGDYDSAISLYLELIQQQPSEAWWFYCLGFQYQKKEQWSDAIAAYSESSRLAPRLLKAVLRLGDAYREAGQGAWALSTYRQGIQSYQNLPADRRQKLGDVYAQLCSHAAHILLEKSDGNSEEVQEGIKLFKETVATSPNDADAWYSLRNALLDVDQAEEALDCLEKARNLNPKKEYIPHKIAQAHLKKNNPDEALREYEQIPQYKRTAYILRGMGQCHMAKNEAMGRQPRNISRQVNRSRGNSTTTGT